MKSDAELRHDRWLRGLDKGFDTAKHLIKWCGIVWVAFYVRDMVSDLAGQTTLADIGVGVLVSTSRSQWVAWLIAVLAILWGLRERNLRRDKIEQFSQRTGQLEREIDPGRSSSQLTTTGETRPEDQ